MSEISLRRMERGDEALLLGILAETFVGFFDLPGTKSMVSSHFFDQDGCFLAVEDGSVVGCVAVTTLPRKNSVVIRYLAVKHGMSQVEVAEKLLRKALEYAETKRAEFLRGTTPAVQPYVDVYRRLGFKAARRDYRIAWELHEVSCLAGRMVDLREVSDETVGEAVEVFVRSLSPYWDWRTEEQGGSEAVSLSFREELEKGEK